MKVEQQESLSTATFAAPHLAAVSAIESAAAFMPWPEKLIQQCIRADYINHVLLHEGVVVGYSLCSTGAGEAHLQNIVVAPEKQGLGWGHWLLDQTVAELKRADLQRLFLEVRASNLPAISLYQRYGFENIGLRKDYYEAPVGREDAYVYVLELSDS